MDVQFIQIYSEVGAGKIGTRHGVEWLWSRYQQEFGETPSLKFALETRPTAYVEAKHIDRLSDFFQQDLVPTLTRALKQNAFPMIISGDHSNAIGTLSALCEANPDKRIGALWIDAHCDLHTPYTTPSGNMHGMSLAAAARQDNLAEQSREPNAFIREKWQRLKSLAPSSAGIRMEDLYFLGLRSYEKEEAALLAKHNVPHFSAEQIRALGIEKVLAQVVAQFSELDLLYVTFDVDALDSRLIPATGTPEPDGFSAEEVAQIFQAVLTLPNLAMFELTEFNPTLSDDPDCYERVYQLFKQAVALCKRSV